MNRKVQKDTIENIGTVLLKIGSLLMCSGATAARTRMIIDRISNSFKLKADLFITHRALTITVTDPETGTSYSALKRTPPPGVNFKLVSGISRMSWSVMEGKWNLEQIRKEIHRIESLPHFHRLLVLGAVGLADACFCYFIGGAFHAMLVSFLATFAGLFIRQEAHRFKFNPYICVLLAAFTATMIAGAFRVIFPDETYEPAFASCVLFLIPGVPMINAFTDLIDGNILNGILKGVNGLIIAFMIALGMVLSISFYNF